MSSVVRVTTGITITASEAAPANAEKWPMGATSTVLDKQTHDNRRRAELDVVHEADDARDLVVTSVLGHVGAGEDADRSADGDACDCHDQRPEDGIQQTALGSGAAASFGEDLEGHSLHALQDERFQHERQEEETECGGREAKAHPDRIGSACGDCSERSSSGASLTFQAIKKKSCTREDDEGDHEQDQTEQDQRRRVEIANGFSDIIGNRG